MDENTIFKPINTVPQEAGIQPEISNVNPVVSPPPTELPSAPPPSIISKVLKILLGIAIIVGIFYAVYNLVLPKLFPAKINQAKITYWGLLRDVSVMTPIIADFERKYPNIEVEYLKQDVEDYRERLVTRINNGNGPDIFRFHNTWLAELPGLLLPLPNSVISKEEFTKNYYPVVNRDMIKNGAIYGIPLGIDTLNLFINKSLFQAAGLKAPTTWIEFGNYARQLTVKDEGNRIKTAGAAMGTYSNITHAPDILSMLFVQDGVDLDNISSSQSEISDALNFYSSFALPDSNVWDDTLDQSIKAFASGTLAMYFGYSTDFFTIKSMNPGLVFDIYQVPSLPGQSKSIASYWAEGVSSKTKYQKEAFLFLQYLTSKEVVQKLYVEESKSRNFGEPYARIDLAQSLSNSVVFPFVQSAPSAMSSYFVDGTYDGNLNTGANNYLQAAINSMLKGASSETAASTLSQETANFLNQYGL